MDGEFGNVKKCAVGKHPKSEKLGGIESGRRLRLRPLPVLHRRQSQRVARIDPNAVVVDKNIAENDRFDLFSRQLVCRDLVDLLFFERGEKLSIRALSKQCPVPLRLCIMPQRDSSERKAKLVY